MGCVYLTYLNSYTWDDETIRTPHAKNTNEIIRNFSTSFG